MSFLVRLDAREREERNIFVALLVFSFLRVLGVMDLL